MSTPPSDQTSRSNSEGPHSPDDTSEKYTSGSSRRPAYEELFGPKRDDPAVTGESDATQTDEFPAVPEEQSVAQDESDSEPPIDAEFSDVTSARDVVPENNTLGEDAAFSSYTVTEDHSHNNGAEGFPVITPEMLAENQDHEDHEDEHSAPPEEPEGPKPTRSERFFSSPIAALVVVVVALALAGVLGATWMAKNNSFHVSKDDDTTTTQQSETSSAQPSATPERRFPTSGGKTIKGDIGDSITLDGTSVTICGESTGFFTRSATPPSIACSFAEKARDVYNSADDRNNITVTSPVSGSDFTLKCSEVSTDLVLCKDDDIKVFLGL